MLITDRDLNVIKWINHFGAANINQIATFMSVKYITAYNRVMKLLGDGYLIRKNIFHGQPMIYHVTRKGAYICQDSLSPLKHINVATLKHDLLVIDLSLILTRHYQGRFVTERELRNEIGLYYFGSPERPAHVSDGEFLIDDKRIAIEVELSIKTKKRREDIFNHYLKSVTYQEFWYFCGSIKVRNQLLPYASKGSFFKLFMINDVLSRASEPPNAITVG